MGKISLWVAPSGVFEPGCQDLEYKGKYKYIFFQFPQNSHVIKRVMLSCRPRRLTRQQTTFFIDLGQ